ncbi:MAG: peptide/nickel transport system permease protein [Kribbellaceae bacterium]|jgi:peptide/nickel transport system permease protein|nr:peptide/nickel transport system permease protein [Kribbellaceae bacterium]
MATQVITAIDPDAVPATPTVGSGWLGVFISGLRRSVTGMIGFIAFMLICIGCLVGPYLVTPDKVANLSITYQAPSSAHWLGTDGQGQDTLKQILAGGQDVIIVGLISALLSTLIAVSLGSIAAYKRGWVDSLAVQVADFFLTIPQFPLLVVLSAYLSLDNVLYLAVLLGALGWPGLTRAVRAQVLSLKEREYVEAARLVNLSTPRIIFREILPNMASYLMINFILGMTSAVYALAGLYLLGLAPMSGTNWGIMINQAWVKGALFHPPAMWYILSPLIAISLLQLSAIWLVRSLEEMLNPRLRAQG